ncbi:hypothetical protein Tco_0090090 [Tanacetum coccineum]
MHIRIHSFRGEFQGSARASVEGRIRPHSSLVQGRNHFTSFCINHSSQTFFLEDEDQEIKEVVEIEETIAHRETAPREVTTNKVLPCELPKVNYYLAPYEPPVPFPGRFTQHAEEALAHKIMESLKRIKVNCPPLKEIRQTDDYAKQIKNRVVNKLRTSENGDFKMNPRCSALLQNQLLLKEQDPRSFILPCSIGKLTFNNALEDLGASVSIMPFLMNK